MKKLCNVVIPTPAKDYKPAHSLAFKVASSKVLWISAVVVLLIQAVIGTVQLLTYTNGVNYHIIFFVLSLNLAIFFMMELVVKVSGTGFVFYSYISLEH